MNKAVPKKNMEAAEQEASVDRFTFVSRLFWAGLTTAIFMVFDHESNEKSSSHRGHAASNVGPHS